MWQKKKAFHYLRYIGGICQEIYCDPVAWLKEGTVDYLSPQLYWKIGGAQDYNKLCAGGQT